MRWLIVFTVVLAGCVVTLPPGDNSITADLACEAARMLVQLRQEIAPSPSSDKCENCDGTGKLGDGRIVTTCPVCGGTGKKPKSVLVNPPCPDGKCRP